MKELKCPKCNSVFSVDEADYATILAQVKNREFEAELARRTADMEKTEAARREADELKLNSRHRDELAARDRREDELRRQIAELQNRIDGHDMASRLELEQAKAAGERDKASALAVKDKEIADLRTAVANSDARLDLALSREKQAAMEQLQALDKIINNLKLELESERRQAAEREKNMEEKFNFYLEEKDREIKRLRDFRLEMSTKMVGESLEQYCSNAFNEIRAMAFPRAVFGKDNDSSGGSKGDFIFRDYDGEDEYISIMFEMKNEMETTAGSSRHRNEDFFDKLHRDRTAKNCEYAVLVSMLESDNALYNRGIVDVSAPGREKMFVIRPQFFIPVISLLCKAARGSVKYMRELELARNQSVDITNFEIKLDKFKGDFSKHMGAAHKKYSDAIERIDKAIKALSTIRELFEGSERELRAAENTLENNLTIRKLTWGNPTMKAMFEEARRSNPPAIDETEIN